MKEEQGMVDLLEYALKIGERKYDEERDREDALISQASQMQTVFFYRDCCVAWSSSNLC